MRLGRLAQALGALFTAVLLVGAAPGEEDEKSGPPFADAPKEEVKPKPASRTWNVTHKGFSYGFSFVPGIPDPQQVVEVLLVTNEVPKTPHPRFGNRVPVDGARITVEVTNPAGQLVGKFLAHPIPLSSSKYGFHVTPTQDGIYNLAVRGKTSDGKELAADLKMPVNVWPLPKELEGSGDGEAGPGVRSVIRMPVKN